MSNSSTIADTVTPSLPSNVDRRAVREREDSALSTDYAINLSSSVDSRTVREREDSALPTENSTVASVPLASEATDGRAMLADAYHHAEGLAEAERRRFTSMFLQVIHDSEFEFGFSTPADEYLCQSLVRYPVYARAWINDLYLQHINDPFVTCAILRVIAHLNYAQLSPEGMTMAAAAFAHTDVRVRECGIRCFENWENPKSLTLLRSLSFPEGWLADYLGRVISDLEVLSEHAVSR